MAQLMRAYVVDDPGGPEAFTLRQIPWPAPGPEWVLVRVRAFGLNRSEWSTRMGESPIVQFPRVLGIERVGEVVSAPGSDLAQGQRVAAMMAGMGRVFGSSELRQAHEAMDANSANGKMVVVVDEPASGS